VQLTIYQLDAFTNKLFQGNPAAIIPLEKWLDTDLMQKIAMENNLSETAFFVPSTEEGIDFELRWFTPGIEINLCGHATLGSAWIIFNKMDFKKDTIHFNCKSGKLSVEKRGDVLHMDFPLWKPERFSDYPDELMDILKVDEIVGVYKNRDLLVELLNEEAVKKLGWQNPQQAIGKKFQWVQPNVVLKSGKIICNMRGNYTQSLPRNILTVATPRMR